MANTKIYNRRQFDSWLKSKVQALHSESNNYFKEQNKLHNLEQDAEKKELHREKQKKKQEFEENRGQQISEQVQRHKKYQEELESKRDIRRKERSKKIAELKERRKLKQQEKNVQRQNFHHVDSILLTKNNFTTKIALTVMKYNNLMGVRY